MVVSCHWRDRSISRVYEALWFLPGRWVNRGLHLFTVFSCCLNYMPVHCITPWKLCSWKNSCKQHYLVRNSLILWPCWYWIISLWMAGWLPAICVFCQVTQVNTLLVSLKYAKILYLYSPYLRENVESNLALALKNERFSEYHIFYWWKLNGIRGSLIMHWISGYELWETSCKPDNLMQILAALAVSASLFQYNCHICSARVYWELWCQAPSQAGMQVGYMLFLFLEQ